MWLKLQSKWAVIKYYLAWCKQTFLLWKRYGWPCYNLYIFPSITSLLVLTSTNFVWNLSPLILSCNIIIWYTRELKKMNLVTLNLLLHWWWYKSFRICRIKIYFNILLLFEILILHIQTYRTIELFIFSKHRQKKREWSNISFTTFGVTGKSKQEDFYQSVSRIDTNLNITKCNIDIYFFYTFFFFFII